MQERTANLDVAIVGYGPVGQALAILLGAKGWSVGVFEKQPQPYPLPRAVHFDHEIGRILQGLGVAGGIAGRTESADAYEWRNAKGDTLLRFNSSALGVSGWPEGNMLAQPELERLLDRRARELPTVQVWRGHEVVGLEDRGEAVDLRLSDTQGESSAATARFVVGCDGSNSFVRQHLGATVTDMGFFYDWLIVDILPHEPRVWSPLNIQICDPLRPTTLVSGGPGRRRWEFMRLPGESLEELNSVATAWRLLADWGFTEANATLERHAVYRFQARCVDTWRKGRLLIAGDAAHQMPPFAGQGMCSGLRDAANLGWKLDLVLSGKAPDGLLDTYAQERVPHALAMIQLSMGLGKVICIADAAEAAARDAAMMATTGAGEFTVPPPPLGIGAGVLQPGSALAGQLFLQAEVECRGARGRFDDVVGGGWTLLAAGGDPTAHLDQAAAAFLARLGATTAQVGAGAAVNDVTGKYGEWFAKNGVEVILQRPDFYLFGAATRLAEAGTLVEGLRTQIEGPARPR